MYGKTKEQLKTRLTISIVTGIIFVVIFFVTQFALASTNNNPTPGLTWGQFIGIMVIAVPAYIVYAFGLLTNWKVQFVEPYQKAKGTTWLLWVFALLFWDVVGCFKTYVVGIKAMIYVFSSRY